MTEETQQFYSLKNKQSPSYPQTFLNEDCTIQSLSEPPAQLIKEVCFFSQEITRKGKQNRTLHTDRYFFLFPRDYH